MNRSILFFTMLVLSTAGISARANSVTKDGNSVTAEKARLELVTLAETGSQFVTVDQVRSLVQSYRVDKENGFMPLRLAPYPRFLINAQLGEIYSALYKSELENFLNHIPLEVLYDGLLDSIAQGTATGELKEKTKQLSKDMALRAIQGKKDPKCHLDESDEIEKVSLFKKIGMKTDIFHLLSPCAYRKRIFNLAKPSLIEARSLPETQEIVRKAALEFDPKLGEGKFENEFRKGFLKSINSLVDGFPGLVQKIQEKKQSVRKRN
jgi:hypothetical protein